MLCLRIHNHGWQNSKIFFFSFLSLSHNLDFLQVWKKQAFENIVGKRDNAGNQPFLLVIRPKGCVLLYPQLYVCLSVSLLAISSVATPTTVSIGIIWNFPHWILMMSSFAPDS